MSRAQKILEMLKMTDAERPEVSTTFSSDPPHYMKKSVNAGKLKIYLL